MRFRLPQFTRSLRFQLVVAVNVPLALLATLFLFYEYRRESAQRAQEKRVALEEEAKTILPAVAALRREGLPRVQTYIDTVCGRMQERESPGHHIAVILPEGALQARAHHRASPRMIAAMQEAAAAPTGQAPMGRDEIIVGAYREANLHVLVSEMMATIRRAARRDLMQRAMGFFILAGVACVTVNFVLLRLVSLPLTELVRVVRRIAAGDLHVYDAAEGREEAGRGQVRDHTTERFSTLELAFLAGEIHQMARALAEADEYRRMQMAKAQEIQRHLLVDDSSIDAIQLASRFFPADEVGGDYYDVITLSDGRILICVADITGHGVAAAMATMLLRSLLHTAVEQRAHPKDILRFINRHFWESTLPGDFATACLVLIDPRRRRLTYASAGHESAWIVSQSGAARELESTGLILGIDDAADWDEREFPFDPGDRLLIVTDGVTETFGPHDRVFGRERLVEIFASSADRPLQDAVQSLTTALAEFRQGTAQLDDVTIVLAAIE